MFGNNILDVTGKITYYKNVLNYIEKGDAKSLLSEAEKLSCISNVTSQLSSAMSQYNSITSNFNDIQNLVKNLNSSNYKETINGLIKNSESLLGNVKNSEQLINNLSKSFSNIDFSKEFNSLKSDLQGTVENSLKEVTSNLNNLQKQYTGVDIKITADGIDLSGFNTYFNNLPDNVLNKFTNLDIVQNTFDIAKRSYEQILKSVMTIKSLWDIRCISNVKEVIDLVKKIKAEVQEMQNCYKMLKENLEKIKKVKDDIANGNYVRNIISTCSYTKFSEHQHHQVHLLQVVRMLNLVGNTDARFRFIHIISYYYN